METRKLIESSASANKIVEGMTNKNRLGELIEQYGIAPHDYEIEDAYDLDAVNVTIYKVKDPNFLNKFGRMLENNRYYILESRQDGYTFYATIHE